MTIKTLIYIHNALIEKEKACRTSVEILRKARNQAEYDESDNFKDLCEAYTKVWNSWVEAEAALREFEEKEWN